MTLGFAVDLLIVLLLAGTIGLCVLLHFRLKVFREGQAEMIRLMEGFGEATRRAELGIQQLKAAGDEVGQRLNENIRKARGLADELAFLVERADRTLENAVTAPKAAPAPPPVRPPTPRQANENEDEGPARPSVVASAPRVAPRAPASPGNASGRVAAHAAYARGLVERRDGADGPIDTDRRDETGARSSVERELLDMLRQAR
jgi:hypothetical protein